MAKPSRVIVLVEDNRHQQLVGKYLRTAGLELHAMRFIQSPSGRGSAEQWVRERFAVEVDAYRSRQTHAETKLVIMVDADTLSVQQRLTQLDQALHEAGVTPINTNTEQIARLIPKRNVETWILCLNDSAVDETTDYKRTHNDWTVLIRSSVVTLYAWTRPNALVPGSCLPSLKLGLRELSKLDFRN
jgi:hypothetical protein